MGCDLFVSPTGFYKKSFNPRTHVGCDREWLFDFAIPEVFQSTHPRGVRLRSCMRKNLQTSFNPRTHVGCDYRSGILLLRSGSFNPRTHMGCDFMNARITLISRSFQSTHPHGVRHRAIGYAIDVARFNPRTHMGCDQTQGDLASVEIVSIHAPTWGATDFG